MKIKVFFKQYCLGRTIDCRNTSSMILIGLSLFCMSCDDFTQTDRPIMELNAPVVFEEMETADAAVANIFAKMRDNGMLTGKSDGISKEMGLYADELTWYGNSAQSSGNFFTNTLLPTHVTVSTWWNNAYSQIYAANAIIEGVSLAENLSDTQKDQLIGEAKFARALLHFYLMQLYGDIPYVTLTDYNINKSIEKLPTDRIYDLLIADMEAASELLPEAYLFPTRTRPNASVAQALLARFYLYNKRWPEAANSASAVLNQTEIYTWVNDLDAVFLKESKATIWQYAARSATRNTDDGTTFIFNAAPPRSVALTSTLMEAFESGDLRKSNWTRLRANVDGSFYHSFKYKKMGANTPQTEYTILIRLAEMYLIRAEARAQQGELIGAKEDLNKIRGRAGLPNTIATNTSELLQAIIRERRVELFTEFGHRFMDLKRTGLLDENLANKIDWQYHERNLPIPQSELNLNSSLGSQNQGY